MIYPYLYLSGDKIEKLHEYVESFFDEMYKSTNARFTISLLKKDFYALAKKNKNVLLTPLKKVYTDFKSLPQPVQKRLYLGFKSNNLIHDLCKGIEDPITYKQIDVLSKPLSTSLKKLFTSLYTDIINPEHFPSKQNHFVAFKRLNTHAEICPFCGLEPLLNEFDGRDSNRKDDYDHWLSKGKYPFNSVNFTNLVPMCDKCNRRYKMQTDTLFAKDVSGKKAIRRKVFFPYDSTLSYNGISASIEGIVANLEKDNGWEIKLHGDPSMSEEIESWNQIFDIDTRYKNRIRTRYKNNWYEQIIKIYKRNVKKGDFDFVQFKNEVYDGLRPLNVQESSIIERAYYDFFFADSNCEYNLSKTVMI